MPRPSASHGEPRRAIHEFEKARPEPRRVAHRAKIGSLGERVELLVTAFVEIGDGDFDIGRSQFQRFAHVACGRIVAVPESRRGDEHLFHKVTHNVLGLGDETMTARLKAHDFMKNPQRQFGSNISFHFIAPNKSPPGEPGGRRSELPF
jgi:hypothetical protein